MHIDRAALSVEELPTQKRYISDDDFAAVYAKAPAVIQVAMDIALLMGLRRGDLLSLRRADCKDDGVHQDLEDWRSADLRMDTRAARRCRTREEAKAAIPSPSDCDAARRTVHRRRLRQHLSSCGRSRH